MSRARRRRRTRRRRGAHHVAVAHDAAQPVRDRCEHLVAGVMPEAVVQYLEAVDVEQDDAGALAAAHLSEHAVGLVLQVGTGQQTRDAVEFGQRRLTKPCPKHPCLLAWPIPANAMSELPNFW